jgi:hypothetical protein
MIIRKLQTKKFYTIRHQSNDDVARNDVEIPEELGQNSGDVGK